MLSRVLSFTRSGWPEHGDAQLQPFSTRKQELSVEGNCMLWGTRVIIPQKHRTRVLQELHREHSGMSQMKAIARSYVWWPGMDQAIEAMVKASVACQSVKSAPAAALCTLGCGQPSHGNESTSILLDHFEGPCFWWWWTPTLSGLRCANFV